MRTILLAITLLLNVSLHAREPLIVAHRGASRDAPENTLPAFKLAWEQGADAIEGDFHLTKDGHIVCIHDDNTKRVSNSNMVVRNSSLAELRVLDVGSHRGEAFKGVAIPILEEVLSTVPEHKSIYLEIKCGPEIIPALLEDIRNSSIKEDQIVVISFNKKVIMDLKAKAPSYKAYWLCSFEKKTNEEIAPSLEAVMDTLETIQADGLSSNITIPESFIEAVVKKGHEWHVWTIDDLNTANRAKRLGAKSITTNMPRVMSGHGGEAAPEQPLPAGQFR